MSNWWEKEENWFDCFEELEIDENASAEKIKNAFRTLAKKYHPDNKEYGDEKKFKKLKIAYETLKDKKTKEEYIAYKKKREKNKDNFTEEENITFETILNNYKERENQVKLAINKMIVKVEEKEEKTSMSLVMVGDYLIHSSVYKDAAKNAGGTGYDFKPMLKYRNKANN